VPKVTVEGLELMMILSADNATILSIDNEELIQNEKSSLMSRKPRPRQEKLTEVF